MRKQSLYTLAIAVVVLLTMAACDSITEMKTDTFENEVGNASSAEISIELGFESGTLTALESTDPNLFVADLEFIGDIEFNRSGSRNRTITLREDSEDLLYTGDETLDWDIRLHPEIPTDLTLDVRSGAMTADLSDLDLNSGDFEVNSGTLFATFPASEDVLSGNIEVNSGAATLTLPTGSNLDFDDTATTSGTITIDVADDAAFATQTLSAKSGQITVTVGENATIALPDITANSGTITITLADAVAFQSTVTVDSGTVIVDIPDGAAVQVNVVELKSGDLQIPESFSTPGNNAEGIYQSAGFADADTQITISAEVDSGTLIIR